MIKPSSAASAAERRRFSWFASLPTGEKPVTILFGTVAVYGLALAVFAGCTTVQVVSEPAAALEPVTSETCLCDRDEGCACPTIDCNEVMECSVCDQESQLCVCVCNE